MVGNNVLCIYFSGRLAEMWSIWSSVYWRRKRCTHRLGTSCSQYEWSKCYKIIIFKTCIITFSYCHVLYCIFIKMPTMTLLSTSGVQYNPVCCRKVSVQAGRGGWRCSTCPTVGRPSTTTCCGPTGGRASRMSSSLATASLRWLIGSVLYLAFNYLKMLVCHALTIAGNPCDLITFLL